ncbi:MAG: asparagine synthase (glutamine-hydrolyzing) [Kiritimatiellia bacterium]
MCGIAGIWNAGRPGDPGDLLAAMGAALRHRGPDAGGFWTDPSGGPGLAHRRLSILDLSPAGAQPMHSHSGRFTTVYNGEIYNYRDLRAELGSGIPWRGHSDTEVMLEAVEAWGVEAAVKKFHGMFAAAIWDARERVLHLFRDPAGIKPLYYGRVGDAFAFASELKALTLLPGFDRTIDREAVAAYVRFDNIPAPRTIYRGIHKLKPGHLVSLAAPDAEPRPRAYWSLGEVVARRSLPGGGDETDPTDELDELLQRTVKAHLVSDVPVGAFLSGGVDSSVVVAAMCRAGAGPVHTFTIGFEDPRFDESAHAERIAAHLGTHHTTFRVTARDALDVVPRLPGMYDEPFSDSSQIPTHLVSRLAREHVTVALAGDGGDELFGGYTRHHMGSACWRRLWSARPPLRRVIGRNVARVLDRCTPGRDSRRWHELTLPDFKTFYGHVMSHWKEAGELVIGATGAPALDFDLPPGLDFTESFMFCDWMTYLPDAVLTKADRASMAASLEVRVPLLDHALAEFAWGWPNGLPHRDQPKWLLREVLARHVPRALWERPKQGFNLPLGPWLRHELRDWAEDLLAAPVLEGIFHPGPIREKWSQHLAGLHDWSFALWTILMFQAWSRDALPSAPV